MSDTDKQPVPSEDRRPTEGNAEAALPRAWALSAQEAAERLEVSPEGGLTDEEASSRRRRHGPNRLRQAQRTGVGEILARQFKSAMVLLLTGAAILALLLQEWVDGLAIIAVIIINTAIGFITELKAVRSMEALQQLSRTRARALRNGQATEMAAEKLVPGDVVLLEGGDLVPADLRLLEASKLEADESALTGESVPVGKNVDAVDEDTPLAERSNMLFKGTAVTRGSAHGLVVGTGMSTELGRISALTETAEGQETPLEKRLQALAGKLIWAAVVAASVAALAGILRGRDLVLMVETAVALAVAALPEGLPIVATIALARGMWRMARQNALVDRLSAVETLGATSVICTDKTGTLTENQMTVRRIALPDRSIEVTGEGLRVEGDFIEGGEPIEVNDVPVLQETLRVGALCTNATLNDAGSDDVEAVGEPMEVALLVAAAKAGMERGALLESRPEVREEAFDPDVKMMATFHEAEDGLLVAVKGAPEAVLQKCTSYRHNGERKDLDDEGRERLLERADSMADEGLRVLATATRSASSRDEDPYDGLTFLATVGMVDPPRTDVEPAIQACKDAGVQVVMVTGDQALTARNVARAVGLAEGEEVTVVPGSDLKPPEEASEEETKRLVNATIFARVTPEQKLHLIDLRQRQGAVVAMTGDGVNDAPALKKADIGIAMGERGTQVAREAADMVLTDDAFGTIVTAVRQGRIIFGNIRKFLLYLLSCNASAILAVSLASLIGAPLPIRPLQILFLNMVTDVFPALALGVGEGDPIIMDKPPRDPQEPILRTDHWFAIGGYGALLSGTVLASLAIALWGLGMDTARAVTVSFLTLAFSQLGHVFNARSRESAVLRNDVVRNPFVWGALLLCTALLLAVVYLPGISGVLELRDPGLSGWAVVLGMSLLPLCLGQTVKLVRSRT